MVNDFFGSVKNDENALLLFLQHLLTRQIANTLTLTQQSMLRIVFDGGTVITCFNELDLLFAAEI